MSLSLTRSEDIIISNVSGSIKTSRNSAKNTPRLSPGRRQEMQNADYAVKQNHPAASV